MVALSHKATQYAWFALKVFILGGAFLFIYFKFSEIDAEAWETLWGTFQLKNLSYVLLFLVLTMGNWIFEIKKWQVISRGVKKISFTEAAQQSLAALTFSIITPSRIGDYGAKALYYEKRHRKKIVFLNFISHSYQLLITVLFGIFGMFWVLPKLAFEISYFKLVLVLVGFLLLIVSMYFLLKKQVKFRGFSLMDIWMYFFKIPISIKFKMVLFSIIRYLFFSYLFYLLLHFFGVSTSFINTFPFIFFMYLVVSIIPTFLIGDLIVRGSVAIWVFSILNISETVIIATVFTSWIFNFLLPAIVGSYYIIKFKRV